MAVCIFINNTDKSLDSLDKADKYISHPSKIAPRGIVGLSLIHISEPTRPY